MIIGALCRVCLSSYSKMHQIANTEYQELFEKLSTKLSTADQRPETVCYICFSHLQRCRRFVELSRKAEEILTQFSLNGIQATHETLAECSLKMKEHLSLSPMKYLFIGDIDDGSQAAVKVEVVSVKEEVAEEEQWVEIEIGNSVSCNKEDGGIKFEHGHDVSTELSSKMDVEQPKSTTTYCCHICSRTFRVKHKLMLHIKQTHTRHLPFGCNWCKKEFHCKTHLARHKKVHTVEKPKESYACDICGKDWKKKSRLVRHMEVHNGKKPYACSICEKQYKHKQSLTTHMRVHTGDTLQTPYFCNICGFFANNKSSLTNHMRVHTGEKPVRKYTCDKCTKTFSKKYYLAEHMKVHTGERPYACIICSKTYRNKPHLTKHMRIHTEIKPYECDICDKKFTLKAHLLQHKRIHTGERPYDCKICNKRFRQNSHLTKHMRVHTGEMPYACDLCGKKFNQKENLTAHNKVHSSEKSYACVVCEKKFKSESYLQNHMRDHSEDTQLQEMS